MLLRDLLEQRGWTNADVAEQLNQAGLTINSKDDGPRPITADDVSRRSNRPVARSWRGPLDVPDTPSPPVGDGAPQSGGGSSESPPTAPPGAKIQPVPVVDRAGAKKRIAWAYSFVGTGLAAGSGYEGIAHVWSDTAPSLAEAWLAAAAENPWAARVVSAAEAGGPVGELVGMHVYLLGATAYVAGAAIPGGDSIFAKYSRHRHIPAVRPEPEPDNQGERAGAGVAGAANGVADLP